MMKSFFKKLAVVLAMAMVVSLAAPAATASAADAKEFTYKHTPSYSSTVTTVNLAKTGDFVDLRFVGIPDYTKYELKWIAVGNGFTVDQNGVITATADEGEGVVWLSVGDDQTYVSDPIKVTIGQLKATIGTQDKSNKDLGSTTLKVGEKMDLAFFGITDWNLGKYGYKWVIGNPSVLDVDQKTGEITALKAGETTVTFMAANKLSPENSVVTAPLTVTVKPSEVTFEVTNNGYNVTQNEVVVEFSEKYAPKNVELFRVFVADDDWTIDGKVDENLHEDAYESVYVNNHYALEGNEYLINPYVDFVDGAIYEIRIDGLAKVWFKASVGAVAKVVVKEDVKAALAEDIEAAVPAELSVDLYDKNNVRVDGAKVDGIVNESPEYITFSLVEDGAFELDVDELTFYDYVAAKVVATYDNGTDKAVESTAYTVLPRKEVKYGVEEIVAWTVAWDWQKDYDIDWNKTNHWLSASDENAKIIVLFKDTRGEYYATDVRGTGAYKYNGKDVKYTGVDETMINAEGTRFADYGYYVEFKAMDPDNLLMDVDGRVKAYQKTKSRWALYLYNYNNQNDQFDKEIFSAVLSVDAEREMDKIDASFNEIDLMYYTEFEDVANAYYSDFSTKNLILDCRDQFDASWDKAVAYDITSVTKGIPEFEELLESYEAELNGVNNDTDLNGNRVRDSWVEIELVDFLKEANYSKGLIGDKTSFSFIIKELNSGDTEKITVNFKTPTDYIINGAGAKVPQGFAVVLESPLTTTKTEERFDLSTNNSVSVTYATEPQWSNSIDTNPIASKNVTVFHKDSKGYKIGYENDIYLGVKVPSYDGSLKKYVLGVEDLLDDTNSALAVNSSTNPEKYWLEITTANVNELIGAKVFVVTKPNGTALLLQDDGNANAALTLLEQKLYGANAGVLATATASGLGVKIKVKDKDNYGNPIVYAKKADGTVQQTYYNYFNIDFMNTVAVDDELEITYLADGNYKATLYTVEGYVYDKYWSAADNKNLITGDTDKDGVLDAGETWKATDVIFSGNSQFKQTTTFKVANNLPQITFAKRLNATTTDDLSGVVASEYDDNHVKELIAENFQFKLDGRVYWHHNNNNGWEKITADDIIAYKVKVSSNNQIVIQNVTLKVYVDWDNDGDITDEDVYYRSTCTVNQSLTYKEER